MKVTINSKKGLKTNISIFVDKKTIQQKMVEKLNEVKDKVQLKGFRPGKVPPSVIKNQFGKAIYGEVIDVILKESSTKAIQDNNIKVAGQPKIELKSFGEGKDLSYNMEIETLPEVKLKSLEKIKATSYEISVDENTVEKRLKEISKDQQSFTSRKEKEKAINGDLVIFDYIAKVDGKDFDNNQGKNVQIVLGKNLFIKGFDGQLEGVSKNEKKTVTVNLPENYPNKELANKKSNFICNIIDIKKPDEVKIDNDLAKRLGAKDLSELKDLIKKQIVSGYKTTLETITKKQILNEIEKNHVIDLPENLVEEERKILTQNLKKEDIDKNKEANSKLARSRIKIGLILNEIGEKNKLKVHEDEIQKEIQKQIKTMPGQEKMVIEYYKKNPSAVSSLRGGLYEDKILELIKTKIKLEKKNINTKEAEKIIKDFTEQNHSKKISDHKNKQQKSKKKKKK